MAIDWSKPVWVNPLTLQPENIPGTAGGGINLTNNSGFTTTTNPSKLTTNSNPYAPMDSAKAATVAYNKMSPTQQAALGNTAGQNGAVQAGLTYGSGKGGATSFNGASQPVNAAPSTPATSATGSAVAKTGMSDYDSQILSIEKTKQAQRDAAISKINGMANPYDTNSDAFKHALAGATNRATMQFSGADQAAQADLAGRGMLGSGYEAATLAALRGQRGATLSDTTNGMYANALQQGSDFGLRQQSAILNALNGNDITNTLMALQARATDENRFNIGRQDMSDSERNAFLLALAKAGVEYGPKILEMLGGGK